MNIHGSILEKKKINVGDARKKVKFASNAKNKLVEWWVCGRFVQVILSFNALWKLWEKFFRKLWLKDIGEKQPKICLGNKETHVDIIIHSHEKAWIKYYALVRQVIVAVH